MKFKIAYNTIVQILGKGVGSLVSLAVTILVAKNFGVGGYGEFTEIMAYVALFYMVADFGMNAIVVREAGEKDSKYWFGNLFGLRVVWSLVLIFLALSIAMFLPYDAETKRGFSNIVKLGIVFGAGMIFVQALVVTANGVFQKFLDYGKSFFALLAGNLVTIVFVLIFILFGLPLPTVILAYVFGGLVMAGVGLFFARNILGGLEFKFDLLKWKEIIKKASPLGLVLIFNLVYFRVDTLMLAFFKGEQDVGIYGLGYKYFELILALPTFFMNSIYPVMVEYAKKSIERLKGMVEASFVFLLIGSVLAVIALWFLSPILVSLVGRQGFEDSVVVLRILALSLPFFFLSSLFMWYLITIKKQRLLVYIYGGGMIINIIMNAVFIPLYTYFASSVITGISEGLVLCALGFVSYKSLKRREDEN